MRNRQYAHKPAADVSVAANSLVQTRPFQAGSETDQQTSQPGELERSTGSFDLTKTQFSFDQPIPPVIGQPLQAKLTISEPNNKYEQEADRSAHTVVQRIHAPGIANTVTQSLAQPEHHSPLMEQAENPQQATLLEEEKALQMKPMLHLAKIGRNKSQAQTNSSGLQRKLTNENAAAAVDSLDVVYELIAHKLAYKAIGGVPAEMGDWLDSQGYERNWSGTVNGPGLFCGLVMPKNGSDKRPVLAFKGTDFSKTGDAMADVDPVAVGFTAFKFKQGEIQALMEQAGGKVDVTGHSLGGALAQNAASAFPSKIRRVVTFQAPGISQEQVRQFNNLADNERPEVAHHIATGDIVDLAGGKHIGGSGAYTGKGNAQFYLHHLASLGPNNHTKFLLQDNAFAQQQGEVGIDQEARDRMGLRNNQIGKNQKVGQYNDNPFAGNQFITERAREFAAPGASLALGGKELTMGGKGLAREGLTNWKQGGWKNRVKGGAKVLAGGVGALVGVGGALAGGVGALAGGIAGGVGGAIAVGAHKTVEGIGEGLSTGANIGSTPGQKLVNAGSDLISSGQENWRQGGFLNRVKGGAKVIGGGVGSVVGGLTAATGGLVGGAVGAVAGGLTGIPRALWNRWKRK